MQVPVVTQKDKISSGPSIYMDCVVVCSLIRRGVSAIYIFKPDELFRMWVKSDIYNVTDVFIGIRSDV